MDTPETDPTKHVVDPATDIDDPKPRWRPPRHRSGRLFSWVEPLTVAQANGLAEMRFGGVQSRAAEAAIKIAVMVYSDPSTVRTPNPAQALATFVRAHGGQIDEEELMKALNEVVGDKKQ
ncbi:hypothetical protein A2690_03350 [Candidatus Roizmanbacteria bacterium RIFCSPHIGHO2_01_FULL_39_12b]|uniref:Uncharacterized protein n=1 Tax=Candidatus Roizmanbacteria bacterium RIFCSPHIGHO2_01_FULL_39_12b TaxID=1802030 RepID=A0A1F7GCM5_9BACT|nr:MAG: hypothetical protein A2690_03350 [Candidatus Roizmanbacteria bacterium RIFCSPHIGHO2_01_FULL_39_12b]OGK46699.1 MAG: hypothetical protein A3B46_02600 [Candidatus Roizmanbacteria bacterium RIFCSPLOWO2_01_FULL_39_19]